MDKKPTKLKDSQKIPLSQIKLMISETKYISFFSNIKNKKRKINKNVMFVDALLVGFFLIIYFNLNEKKLFFIFC